MTNTLLSDIKSDRAGMNILLSTADLASESGGTSHYRVVRIGVPTVQDNLMCAQCIGECKVF